MAVTFAWAGATTDTLATVVAKTTSGTNARLKVSPNVDMSSAVFSASVAIDAHGYVKLPMTGLTADTQYHYEVEVDGVVDSWGPGRFETLPVPLTAASFDVAFGSCWIKDENHKPAVKIKDRHPIQFIHMGDFHYADIEDDDEALYRDAYEDMFDTANIPDLLADVSTAYGWDDHDYGVNNSDKTSPSRTAARANYRRVVPHYPLSDPGAIYQAWSIGRVRFILTDLRSERDVSTMATQTPSSSMMGATQKQWFKDELLAAKEDGYAVIVWVSSNVLIADEAYQPSGVTADDSWADFVYERAELFDYMQANDIDNIVVVCGDMHAVAIGHADYATTGSWPVPVFQAAPLGRIGGNNKGGPYVYPPFLSSSNSHYGLMSITDDGTVCQIDVGLWTVNDTTNVESLKWSYRTKRPLWLPRPVRYHDGDDWVAGEAFVHDGDSWERRELYAV